MIEKDKRQFARYRIDSLCEVRVGSEICKGKAVDYFNGIGVLIKKVPQLVKGAVAEIVVLDCEIAFRAEVVWIEDLGYHLKVGFKSLDNLKGNLKHYRLVDILYGLNKSRKTGILEITAGSTVIKIYIENGLNIFAASTNKNDRLGEYLLTKGKITLEEYNQAYYLVEKRGQRLGQVLIDLGYLKPSDLAPSVQSQVKEIIISLFNIDEGKFEFKEVPLPTDEPIKLKISTANLIYKGIKRINSFPMVDKMCPPLDTVFNLDLDQIPLFKSLTLEFADKKVLSYVNGINPLKTILSLSPTSNFETLKSIISLLNIGLITVKGEDEAPSKLPLEVIFGEPEDPQPEELVEETDEKETAAVDAGTAEWTVEHTNIVENQGAIKETGKEEEPPISTPSEDPQPEELVEETDEKETAAVDAGTAEWTIEYTNIVENQGTIKETRKEGELPISTPSEDPVPEITEVVHEEKAPAGNTENAEDTAKQESNAETHVEITDVSNEQGTDTQEHGKMPVENITEEIREEEASVSADTAEEMATRKGSIENDEITVLSNADVTIKEDQDKMPLENITEQMDEEQPVTDKARYVDEPSSVPEPVVMDSNMAAETGEEAYVQVNDMTSEKTTEVIADTIQLTDDNIDIAEKPRSRNKVVISAVIIIILIGAIVPFVYKYITMPLSPPAATTMKKAESFSPSHGKAPEKATTVMSQNRTSFPAFREDAIKKFLNE